MGSITRSFANNITTAGKFDGTKLTGDIPEANLSANAPAFDDNKVVNDLATLGLRVHTQENLTKSNTNSQYVDTFQDATGFTNGANTTRNTSEYVASVSETITSITLGPSNYTTYIGSQADSSTSQGFMISSVDGTGTASSLPAFNPANTHNLMGGGSYTSTLATMFAAGGNYGPPNYSIYNQAYANKRYYWRFKFKSDYVGFKPTSNYFIWRNGSSYASNIDIVGIDSSNNVTILDDTVSGAPTNNQGYTTSSISGSTYYPEIGWAVSYSNNNGYGWDNWLTGGDIKSLTANATGNFTCPTITAASATTKMGAVITYQDNAGTNALNSDIVLQLSADNGSNFSTATLTALPDFSSGIKMAKVNDLAVTSGTQLKYKISFANQSSGSKVARIRGVSLNY